MTRALAASAYRHGANFVDVSYFDLHVKRARILDAEDDTLDFVPAVVRRADPRARAPALRAHRADRARRTPGCSTTSTRRRAGRDQLPFVREAGVVVNERTTNWTAVPCPTLGLGRSSCIPASTPTRRGTRLCEQILHVCRLDEDDPVAAWRERADTARRRRRARDRAPLRRAALRRPRHRPHGRACCRPRCSWRRASRRSTASSTCPTCPRRRSSARPTRSAPTASCARRSRSCIGGSIIRGLEVEFRDGRAVRIDAEEGADVLRAYAARDEGASRLGEVALVDGDGRIGKLDTVFFDTLLDENAASPHRAGRGVPLHRRRGGPAAPERRPSIHVDFMIGGDRRAVTGVTAGGRGRPGPARRGLAALVAA